VQLGRGYYKLLDLRYKHPACYCTGLFDSRFPGLAEFLLAGGELL